MFTQLLTNQPRSHWGFERVVLRRVGGWVREEEGDEWPHHEPEDGLVTPHFVAAKPTCTGRHQDNLRSAISVDTKPRQANTAVIRGRLPDTRRCSRKSLVPQSSDFHQWTDSWPVVHVTRDAGGPRPLAIVNADPSATMPGDSASKLAIIWTPPGPAAQDRQDEIPIVLLVNCGDFAVRSLPQVVIGSPSLRLSLRTCFRTWNSYFENDLSHVHWKKLKALEIGIEYPDIHWLCYLSWNISSRVSNPTLATHLLRTFKMIG